LHISKFSQDLRHRFPKDDGCSERNLGYMKQFAAEYPDFPFLQVPLAKLNEDDFWHVALAENDNTPILQVPHAKLEKDGEIFVQVPLAQITWYHHISLLPKVKSPLIFALLPQISIKTQLLGRKTLGFLRNSKKSSTFARKSRRKGKTRPQPRMLF